MPLLHQSMLWNMKKYNIDHKIVNESTLIANDHKPMLFSELQVQIESAYYRLAKSAGLPLLNAKGNMCSFATDMINKRLGGF